MFSSRLSPIPSSSSLSTLRTGLELMRNTSCWSPRRISLSVQSCSNSFTAASPPDTNGPRLSYQNLLGYHTLRTLRKVRASSFRSDGRQTGGGSSSGYEDSLIEDALFGGPSSSLSLSGTPRERRPTRDTALSCYMGICLPRHLSRLFPDDIISDFIDEIVVNDGDNRTKHDRVSCLLCSNAKEVVKTENNEDEEHIKIKSDILKHIERLSNPVWSKQSKQALLHLKQRHANVFQDVCLFSDMCAILSSMTFRLAARRFLQELFLDLDFSNLLKEQRKELRERLFSEERPAAVVQADSSKVTKGFDVMKAESTEEGKTADLVYQIKPLTNLKLTCSENKFPIVHRKEMPASPIKSNCPNYQTIYPRWHSFNKCSDSSFTQESHT